jgi:Zn-dependent protease
MFSGGPPREVYHVTTSRTEILHLAIAWSVLTVDIALVRDQITVLGEPGVVALNAFLGSLGIAAVAALSGFVAHEMAHKIVAQRHGFWAEFRMSLAGLFFSLATALFGFLFALPGATMIGGMGNAREWGRTSLAGPVVNLGEGAVFLAAGFVSIPLLRSEPVWAALLFLAFVNGVFASFNLLPFGPLDGAKVVRWSRPLWVGAFGAALLFTAAVLVVLLYAVPVF